MRASLMRKEGEEIGPEIPKIHCAFHTEEFLTNFCSCKGCLLPLCPSCIKIHVNQHISMKTNPHLENVNELLRSIYSQLESFGDKFNGLHKQFVEIETQVEQFKDKLKNKLYTVKHDLIAAIEDHFKRVQFETLQKISDLKYVKNLVKYKELTKRTILSLKNTERNFFTEENKVMRMMIKYEANNVGQQLEAFKFDSENFINLHHDHFFSFSVKDNFAELAIDPLHNLLKIDIHESALSPQPHDITPFLKELYEKQPEKKELKKSLYKFLSTKNTPGRHSSYGQIYDSASSNLAINNDPLSDFAEMISSNQEMSKSEVRPELNEMNDNELNFARPVSDKGLNELYAYESVKESIVKATKDLNFTLNRNSKLTTDNEAHRKRSLSKGKGISLMQSNTTVIDFKKNSHNSILKCDMDLNFINSRTQHISRKCR